MKKNIFKILMSLFVVTFVFHSCVDEALVKSEIDKKFEVATPSVSISEAKNETPTSAEFTLTLSDLSLAHEVGLMASANSDFSNPRMVTVKVGDSNTVDAKINLSANSSYFIKGYVISKSGVVSYSETKQLTTPDVPFVEKIIGTYKSTTMVSYFDEADTYISTITIKKHETEGMLIIENLSPFFVSNGYTADKGANIFEATYSEAAKTITIAAGQLIGYDETATIQMGGAPSLILDVEEDGAVLSVSEDQLWGDHAGQGYYEVYLGGYKYNKQ